MLQSFLDRLPGFVADNLILVMVFAGLTAAIIATEAARLLRRYTAINPRQLTDLINRDDALVVDVSAQADFEKGHIVGARHVAMSQFDPENKILVRARDLPIVVVCRTGSQSTQAAQRLHKAGFTRVHWLDGGVAAWQQADLPLRKGRA